MPTTTSFRPRVFVAPVGSPTRGTWHDINTLDPTFYLKDLLRRRRAVLDSEALNFSDHEEIPDELIPDYGIGSPAVKRIGAYCKIAEKHGSKCATAYVRALHSGPGIHYAPPEEWLRSFERSHAGTKDSMEEWAWRDLHAGHWPELATVAENLSERFIDITPVVEQLEHGDHWRHVRCGGSIHRFEYDALVM